MMEYCFERGLHTLSSLVDKFETESKCGLGLVENLSKELIMVEDCRDLVRCVRERIVHRSVHQAIKQNTQ